MTGNRKPGIGLKGILGVVVIVCGLVAAVAGIIDRGRAGMNVGGLLVVVGGVLLANGVAASRKAASAAQGMGARPPAHEGGHPS